VRFIGATIHWEVFISSTEASGWLGEFNSLKWIQTQVESRELTVGQPTVRGNRGRRLIRLLGAFHANYLVQPAALGLRESGHMEAEAGVV